MYLEQRENVWRRGRKMKLCLDLDVAPPRSFLDLSASLGPIMNGPCCPRCKAPKMQGRCHCTHSVGSVSSTHSPVGFPSPLEQRTMWNDALAGQPQVPLSHLPNPFQVAGQGQGSWNEGKLSSGWQSSRGPVQAGPSPADIHRRNETQRKDQLNPINWTPSSSPSNTPRSSSSLCGGVWPELAPLPIPMEPPPPPSHHLPPMLSSLGVGPSHYSQYSSRNSVSSQGSCAESGPAPDMSPRRLAVAPGTALQPSSPLQLGIHKPVPVLQPLWMSRPRVPVPSMVSPMPDAGRMMPTSPGPYREDPGRMMPTSTGPYREDLGRMMPTSPGSYREASPGYRENPVQMYKQENGNGYNEPNYMEFKDYQDYKEYLEYREFREYKEYQRENAHAHAHPYAHPCQRRACLVDFLSGKPVMPSDAPTPLQRTKLLRRFKEKRAKRSNSKKIKYECRKVLANNRPRIKGRFARPDEIIALGLGPSPIA